MLLEGITLRRWRQFEAVDLSFHDRLTVLTGANGAGKTTILHLLNRHWGWNIPYASTPRLTRKKIRKYWAGFWRRGGEDDYWYEPEESTVSIGEIRYREHSSAEVTVPADVPETFSPSIRPMPAVPGVYVSSHRPLYIQQPVDEIPTKVDARKQIFENYMAELRNRYTINRRVKSPSHTLKRSLISLALFGYGNEAAPPNEEARETFEGFQRVLGIVLPQTLGFTKLIIETPDVVLKTATGNFSLDAVSGGISALIDVAWQVFLYSQLHDQFVVVIDEPEAHLHPQLQRQVLPDLLEAFPSVQFVVATHNPFVVTSVPDSHVYVLQYNEERRVVSMLLDEVNKAGTSNEILRQVLGLESASPAWVEARFGEIVDQYRGRAIDRVMLRELRRDLEGIGLGDYVPGLIDRLLEER